MWRPAEKPIAEIFGFYRRLWRTATLDEAALARSKRTQPQASRKLAKFWLTDVFTCFVSVVLLRREIIHIDTLLYLNSFKSVVSTQHSSILWMNEISPHFSYFWLSKIYQVLARFNTRLMFMYVSSYFTMVPPVLFLVPLSSPWWGQPGHIVRLVPYLSFSSLFTPFLPSSPFSFYPNFLPSGTSLGLLSGSSLLSPLFLLSL